MTWWRGIGERRRRAGGGSARRGRGWGKREPRRVGPCLFCGSRSFLWAGTHKSQRLEAELWKTQTRAQLRTGPKEAGPLGWLFFKGLCGIDSFFLSSAVAIK